MFSKKTYTRREGTREREIERKSKNERKKERVYVCVPERERKMDSTQAEIIKK